MTTQDPKDLLGFSPLDEDDVPEALKAPDQSSDDEMASFSRDLLAKRREGLKQEPSFDDIPDPASLAQDQYDRVSGGSPSLQSSAQPGDPGADIQQPYGQEIPVQNDGVQDDAPEQSALYQEEQEQGVPFDENNQAPRGQEEPAEALTAESGMPLQENEAAEGRPGIDEGSSKMEQEPSDQEDEAQDNPGTAKTGEAAAQGGGIKHRLCSCFKDFRRRFAMFMLKAAVGLAVILAAFFVYFDAVVMEQFEVDDKWVLPAVVYSRPLELYPEQRLSFKQMLYELSLLKYREVPQPQRPGEYAVNEKTGRIVLIKRPFSFPDGEEDRTTLLIEFDEGRIGRLLNADTMQELSYARMDPVLLDRINRIEPKEDRIFITLDEVPQTLITTLLEIEDRRFYDHWGINPWAIGRAFVRNLLAGRVVEGGSTITQQLVKNYFLTNEKSYTRKFKELIMALIMDHRYTKDQILEAYLNEIYLGQNGNAGIYGFGLASYFYFGVPVSELSVDQAALLVGLIKGPSYYDPWRHPDNALERRNTVLAVLKNRGHLTDAQYEQYAAKPLNVIERGSMNYSKTPAFMGVLKHEISSRFGQDFLSGNGIRIFTSLDPQAQIAAETAVANTLDEIEKERKLKGLEAAMVVSSWRTAEISAVVGSRTPKYDGFNRVIEGRRQIGSLAKPMVYLTAFNRGYHLGSIVNDTPVTVKLADGKMWSPKNDDGKFRGPITVLRAMASSLNVPTVRIGMGAGLSNVRDSFRKAGVHRYMPLYPSMLLGTLELTPYELNAMYASMATDGVYQNLTTLRTVVKNGEVVYERASLAGQRTFEPEDTYLTLYAMTQATQSGTGRRLANQFPGVTIASKTGTTNNNRDAWSVGIDSDELVTTWVGFDDNKSTGLYGSSGPLRVYAAYLSERGVNSLELKRPSGIKFVNFDKNGQVVDDNCRESGLTLLPARTDKIAGIRRCDLGSFISTLPQAPSQDPAYQQGQAMPAPGQNTQPSQPAAQPAQPAPAPAPGTVNEQNLNDFEKFLLGL